MPLPCSRPVSLRSRMRCSRRASNFSGNPKIAGPMARFCLPLSLTVALSVAPARAADLLQIYRDALANDAAYGSTRAARDAGLENLPQGLAQILPTVNATPLPQRNDINLSFRAAADPSLRQSGPNRSTVTLHQPG